MVGGRDAVRVLNCSAFHDTNLVCSGDLVYLGESWSKTVGSAVSFSLSLFNSLLHIYVQILLSIEEIDFNMNVILFKWILACIESVEITRLWKSLMHY